MIKAADCIVVEQNMMQQYNDDWEMKNIYIYK